METQSKEEGLETVGPVASVSAQSEEEVAETVGSVASVSVPVVLARELVTESVTILAGVA